MRVLVLTSRTGGGHDARAEAFRDWVARLYGAAVEVRIDHALENASPWNARGVAFYNAIQRYAPWFHHLYYNIGEIFGAVQRDEVQVGRSYCRPWDTTSTTGSSSSTRPRPRRCATSTGAMPSSAPFEP